MKNIISFLFFTLIFSLPIGKGWGWACFSQSKIVLKDKTVLNGVKVHHIYFNKIEYEEKGSLHDMLNANIERIETDTAILSFDENGNTLSRPYDYIVKATNDTIFCLISQLGGNYVYYYAKGKDNRSYISTSSLKDYKKFEPQPLSKQEEKPQQTITQTYPDSLKDKKDTASQTTTPQNVDEPPVFTMVEEMPAFPGGEEELFKYLSQNIKYPAMAKDAGISGIVYVTFVVMEDGQINDVKVLRGVGGGCDEEAIRVVKSMPQWKAGKQKGKPVRVQFNLPIRFTLKGNETVSKKETTENAPVSVGVDGKKIVEAKQEIYEEQYEESNEDSENDELLRQSLKNDLCYESYMKGMQAANAKEEYIWAFGACCMGQWANLRAINNPASPDHIPSEVDEKCFLLGYQNQNARNRIETITYGQMIVGGVVMVLYIALIIASI